MAGVLLVLYSLKITPPFLLVSLATSMGGGGGGGGLITE